MKKVKLIYSKCECCNKIVLVVEYRQLYLNSYNDRFINRITIPVNKTTTYTFHVKHNS